MVSPLKYVMAKYCTLVHKMHEDQHDLTSTHDAREAAKANYDLLVELSVPIALACFFVHCWKLSISW